MENLPEIALSVRQPWAELLVRGIKKVEVRTWKCPREKIEKRIAIHAGKQIDNREFIWKHFPREEWREIMNRTGGFVGEASLRDCIKFTCHGHFAEYRPVHLNQIEDYEDGLFGFVFASAKKYETIIPYIGQLNFFAVNKQDINPDNIGGQDELQF
jgi:hypothetical protein